MPRDTSGGGRNKGPAGYGGGDVGPSRGGGGSKSGGGSFGGGGRSGGGGSLRGADGMTASQRAATRDSRLGLKTGATWKGNTAYGPAGGRAAGFTNVRTGGGRMTKTQRDAVGPGTMPRSVSPSQSGPAKSPNARPISGPPRKVAAPAKKAVPAKRPVAPAVKRPLAPTKPPRRNPPMSVTGGLGIKPYNNSLRSNRVYPHASTYVRDVFYGGKPTQGGKTSLPPGRSVKDYGPGKGDLGVSPRPTKFRT